MNPARLVVFLIGVVLVIVAGWMLFFETGLNRWVPIGVAIAALLLFIGVAVMGASESMPRDRSHTRERVIERERP